MKRIGIISGSGSEAGVDLWSKILLANREYLGSEFKGDLDAPEITIRSVPELGLSIDMEANREEVKDILLSATEDLKDYADLYGIACNTINAFQRILYLQENAPEFVSVADACKEFLSHKFDQPIALLGTRHTMAFGQDSGYADIENLFKFEVAADPFELHQLIEDVKKFGPTGHGLSERLSKIVEELKSDTVLLACTELPLIATFESQKELVDVSDLLAKTLIKRAYGENND